MSHISQGPIPVFIDPFQNSSYRGKSQASKRLSQNSYCWDRSSFDLDNDETEKVPRPTSSSSLPAQDGGRKAWTVLIAGFVIQAMLFGVPRAFGCFQEYYLNSLEYKDDTRAVMIGTLAISLPDLGAPFMSWFVARYPRYRIWMMWPGWLLCIGGLVAASYAPDMPVLVVTQGLMYGLGGLIVFYPMLSLISEWWNVKLGLAYGVLDCSWGFTGAPLPFLLTWLLGLYGSQWTLRILAIGCGVLTLPAMILVTGRVPRLDLPSKPVRQSYSFFRNPLFHVYIWATFFQGLGYFTPGLFLPTYVVDLNFVLFNSPETGAAALTKAVRSSSDVLLALLAIASIPSALLMGWLSDKHNLISLPFLAIISAVATTLSVTLLWGYLRNLYALIPFAILFSLFGAGWEVLWGRMSLAVIPPKNKEDDFSDTASVIQGNNETHAAGPMQVYALLNFARGISELVAGAVGGKFLLIRSTIDNTMFGAGKYMPLIVWTASGLGAATFVLLCWWILPKRVTRKFDAVTAAAAAALEEEVLIIEASGKVTTVMRSRANTAGIEHGVRARRFTSPVSPMRVVSPIAMEMEKSGFEDEDVG